MPTNRRSGTNRQPAARRPKVAGLRKPTASPASTPVEDEHVNGNATPEAAEQEPKTAEPAAPEAAEPASAEVSEAAADSASSEESSAAGSADEPAVDEPSDAETSTPESSAAETSAAESSAAETSAAKSSQAESEESGSEDAAEPESEESKSEEQDSGKTGSPWVLWSATAVLAALAIFFGVATYTTYNTGSAANEALTSAGETSEVNGQISEGVEKLFSYDFNDTAKTENAAKDLLVGSAVQKYNELFALVKQQAPQQQLIVTTTAKNSAVTHLEGDRAEVLVFLDQHAMRANTGESNIGPAQLSVSAEKQGDKWKITQLTLR
ncbi:hypothetical protein [Saccharopolyspora dendranthemae]|uniref:Mce-associated membrane protein n=1 Tax=Saccharopolyspora dendranthemae TaxID=1181886 RepID=A0A561U1A2_9PSEU|nr:hypothetical protein [Saccharopolyspora dendranthemae]TWF93149.1 Mce-associated membrane protein [Saccharopolyspora dendranthemae]